MINKKDICIIIPIYKVILDQYEFQSIIQCLKVLSEYKIYFVCPTNMNIEYYRLNFSEVDNYVCFDEVYFKDIKGYNQLMLSPFFYKTFSCYKYMLIYQTDCYVFRDELLDWVNKKYDYIGGVLFDDYEGNPDLGAKIWLPANGGFSIRNIDVFIKLLSSKKTLKGISKLFNDAKRLKKLGVMSYIKGLLLLPFRFVGYRNNFAYRAKNYSENEDGFFIEAAVIYKALKLPGVEAAIGFSWDRHPDFLFDTYGSYPFGCHAWFREDTLYRGNKEFWLKHINKDHD